MNNISKYMLVYNITALPTILYASMTPADEPLTFDATKLTVPPDLVGTPIELRVAMYNPQGVLIELASNMLPANPLMIANSAQLTGLKLVKKLIDNLKLD